jgi:hypothetical protein
MIFFTAGASMVGAFVAGYCCAREIWEHHRILARPVPEAEGEKMAKEE